MRPVHPIPSRQVALWVVLSGVVAALHVGKLPAAIPVLAHELDMTLVQGGFLLALIQLAGMALGAVAGSLADHVGPRRIVLTGLVLLALGSGWGAWAQSPGSLMVLRGIESMGFLLSVIAAPVLLRRWVTEPKALQRALGFWGAYMPIGMASALLVTPWAYDAIGWRWTWVLLAWASVAVAIIVLARVPPDADRGPLRETPMMAQALKSTLSAPGPWLVALAFMVYSGQWMAVIGFLPTIYHQAGWPPDWIGPLTAGAAGVNMIGNILAGRWLARGAWPGTLLAVGYLAMGVGAWGVMSGWLAPTGQYLSVLLFSWVGGMIPATLISLAMHLAPSRQTVTTTVGWVQQLSSMGQFLTPPLMAAIAADFGGWHHAVWLNLVLAGCGLWLAWRLQSRWSRLTR